MNHYDYLDGYRESAGTVYIVDDDDAVRDSLKWLLEASNYHVRASSPSTTPTPLRCSFSTSACPA